MGQMILHPELCKGCEYCVVNCPKSAITLTGDINKNGYSTPRLDRDRCIVCGICYNVCPDMVYEIVES
jgi:2-oxoglutarate ferredoxin oxidoreductase subunit delta